MNTCHADSILKTKKRTKPEDFSLSEIVTIYRGAYNEQDNIIPFTPLRLISEITRQIDINKDRKIAVMFTYEWTLYLKYTGYKNITLITDKETKFFRRACDWSGTEYITLDQIGNRKFDVVVGNPPYQSGNGESGGKHSLWRKFVKASFGMLTDDGIVSLICPGFPVRSSDLGPLFRCNTPLFLRNDARHWFPNIGSQIKYWAVQKGKHNKPFVVDGSEWNGDIRTDDPTANPIISSLLNKLNTLVKFECLQDSGYNSTQLKNDPYDYFEFPQHQSVFPIRHASKIKTCFVSAPTKCHYLNKVMMTFSGNPDFRYFDGLDEPMSSCYQMSGYILVQDKTEGESLIKLYQSKLYKFLSSLGTSGMRGVGCYSLPKVDLTRSWTDEELYVHFKLTQEEIDLIESFK